MKSLKGHFLIASPALQDPNFARAVVLLLQHDDEGALGLVINREAELSLRQLWEKIGKEECAVDAPLHVGGPCEGTLMVLHTHQEAAQAEVVEGVYFSAQAEHIHRLV